MGMIAARDGLPLENAPRTRSIWSGLQSFLATVGEVVRCVRNFTFMCFPHTESVVGFIQEILVFIFSVDPNILLRWLQYTEALYSFFDSNHVYVK